ncbi:hypothetical protein HSX37_16155|uniref:Uncharacterized protein n=1 Tax=Dendrosporobacter quercicolus TaxID=146817 RepID=A0A1G9ZP02_9FIRM|nr:hypothetical protein [Dendrosporobacter quercicolus]NSL49569.1 hypothetical protein [Dendrosporobacter quercicolus DSM 1736]SDN23078.1 hypothetical protein SAMN04488502_11524 [Dendrosporobacter quercicolus]
MIVVGGETFVNCCNHTINTRQPVLRNYTTGETIGIRKIDLGPCEPENHLRVRNGVPDSYDHIPGRRLIVSSKYQKAVNREYGNTFRLVRVHNYSPEKGYADRFKPITPIHKIKN